MVRVGDINGMQYIFFIFIHLSISISNSIGEYLNFGDVYPRYLPASLIVVICFDGITDKIFNVIPKFIISGYNHSMYVF